MSDNALEFLNNKYPTEEFYLMNKDEVILKFLAVLVEGKYIFNVDVSSIYRLPPKFKDITSFLETRTIITHRAEIFTHLKELGITNRFEVLLLNYGVSLVDTLWVKRCSDPMTWSAISPYTKERVFSISWFASDSKLNLKEFKDCRPEYSTNGNFPKCWITRSGEHILVKCGSSGSYNSGLEPFSEVYSTQVAEALGFADDAVEYSIVQLDYSAIKSTYKLGKFLKENISCIVPETTRFATECKAFTSESVGFVSASELGLSTYEDVIAYADKIGKQYKVARLLLLDCLTVNVDRHLGNIGFLYDNDTFEVLDVAPCFDNNLALLCYWVEALDGTASEYVETCTSKLGLTFAELGQMVLLKEPGLRDYLKEIRRSFEIKESGCVNLRRERLDDLSRVVRNQAAMLLM